MKTALFVIDPQNDFCDPQGSLYVPNAEADMARLADMIENSADAIDHIVLTADDHLPNDIAHPRFWQDSDGNMPAPFTSVSLQDVESGKYIPAAKYMDYAREYLSKLEQKGVQHTIWPMHCVSGTWGADIESQLMASIMAWSANTDNHFRIVRKGYYPFTEHYGAFQAEVPSDTEKSTQYNQELLDLLDGYDRILVAGEAKSHCVMNTIRQMMEHSPAIMAKTVILEDAMSPVVGFGDAASAVFAKAVELGARICKTTDIYQHI